MNEPWPGSAGPSCINVLPACESFDKGVLAPFYRRVIKAIRAVDRRTSIHYEPELLHGGGIGYDMGPSSDANSVLSFRVYCVTYTITLASTPGCDTLEELVFANAEKQAARGKDALLLTEFGSTSDVSIIGRVADKADEHMVGWLEWTYYSQPGDSDFPLTPSLIRDPRKKPEGANINASYLGALSRAYPESIAGTPRSWSYDAASRRFALSYSTASPQGHARMPRRLLTTIVVPRRQYPDGYTVTVSGGTVVSRPGAQILKIARRAGATGVGVSVRPARGKA